MNVASTSDVEDDSNEDDEDYMTLMIQEGVQFVLVQQC